MHWTDSKPGRLVAHKSAFSMSVVAALMAVSVVRAQTPQFEVMTIDGRALQGSVTVDSASRVKVAAAGSSVEVALDDVMAMSNSTKASPAERAASATVWLRSGTVLPALRVDGIAGDGDQPGVVVIDTVGGAQLELPLNCIAALRYHELVPDSFASERSDPRLNKDYLHVVKKGELQRFSVTVLSIREGKVQFELNKREYDYPLTGADSVSAVVFGKNTGFAPDRQGQPRVRLQTVDGAAVEGRLLAMADAVSVGLDEGVEFTVPTHAIVRVDVLTDKLTWLNALQPKVEQTAAFDRTWPWTIDGSPAGPGLSIGGKQFTRGLCLVPRTRLSYDTAGKYDVFEAVIGIDDRGGPQAHAIFRVLGDGEVLYESDPKTLGMEPEAIRVELGKCKVLAIEADFGKNFDLGDLCAFADARILQQ